jgi:hypothetical protein
MKLTEEVKSNIDKMTYQQMLSQWRFAPSGTPMFQDESGKYFAEVMSKKKNELTHEEQVTTSKSLGWDI